MQFKRNMEKNIALKNHSQLKKKFRKNFAFFFTKSNPDFTGANHAMN